MVLRNPKPFGIPMHGREFGCRMQESGGSNALPKNYPPTNLATEIWNWGEATGAYESEIQGDTYSEAGSSPDITYQVAGPPNTSMKAVHWDNSGSNFSKHQAASVNANLAIGSSSFKFYFVMRALTQASVAYYFFDYDLQENASTFNEGIQFFVSSAGLFAPASLVAIMKDDNGEFAEFHAKLPNGKLFNDGNWHFIELVFNRANALPSYYFDGQKLTVLNTFDGIDLTQLGNIDPVGGISFGMREYTASDSLKANIQMASAAYSKNLSYVWK